MKLDQETIINQDLIDWIQIKIAEICKGSGFGYVDIRWNIREGKLNGKDKIAKETEKEVDK